MNQREQDDLNARLRARATNAKICEQCGRSYASGPMAHQCDGNDLMRRQARAVRNMPPVVTCDNCGLTYYQTSAPHVCAGWATTKLTKETTMSGAGECRDQYDTWMNDLPTCEPARQAAKENEMSSNTTGYPVIDQILESIAPSQLCVHSDDDGATHCGLVRESHVTLTNYLFVGVDEHEPVVRGGEGEWWELGPLVHHGGIEQREVRRAGVDPFNGGHVCIAAAVDAEQIVTEHNQHRSLLTEREKYAQLLRAAKVLLSMNNCNYDREAMRSEGGFDALQKAVDAIDQKGE